jgi:hypothetical protein
MGTDGKVLPQGAPVVRNQYVAPTTPDLDEVEAWQGALAEHGEAGENGPASADSRRDRSGFGPGAIRDTPGRSTGVVYAAGPAGPGAVGVPLQFSDAKPDVAAYGVALLPDFPIKLPFGVKSGWILSPSGNPLNFSETGGNVFFVSMPTKYGGMSFGRFGSLVQGGVATYNPATKDFEAGWGGTFGIKLPGNIRAAAWLNIRANDLPPGFGTHYTGRISGNIGGAISALDGAARILEVAGAGAAVIPGGQPVAAGLFRGAAGLEALGKYVNGFAGAGWRVEFQFKNGTLDGIYYHGKEIVDLQGFVKDKLMPMLDRDWASQQRLAALGLSHDATHDAAATLAPYFRDRDPAAFFNQMTDYLNRSNPEAHVSAADVVKWFNGLEPAWQKQLAGRGLQYIEPDPRGNYSTSLTIPRDNPHWNLAPPRTLADFDRYTAFHKHPMPGSRWKIVDGKFQYGPAEPPGTPR